MALKKPILTVYGINAEYWKIINLTSDFKGSTNVTIAGYLNKNARFEYAQPLYITTRIFNLEDITRVEAYTELKKSELIDGEEQNIFANALDD
jgi:hypothetical protein